MHDKTSCFQTLHLEVEGKVQNGKVGDYEEIFS